MILFQYFEKFAWPGGGLQCTLEDGIEGMVLSLLVLLSKRIIVVCISTLSLVILTNLLLMFCVFGNSYSHYILIEYTEVFKNKIIYNNYYILSGP